MRNVPLCGGTDFAVTDHLSVLKFRVSIEFPELPKCYRKKKSGHRVLDNNKK
jgi:hypothetical protein